MVPWLAARAIAPATTSLIGLSPVEGGGGGAEELLGPTFAAPLSLACKRDRRSFPVPGRMRKCPIAPCQELLIRTAKG